MNPALQSRTQVQQRGRAKARSTMFHMIADGVFRGQIDASPEMIALIERIHESAFTSGVEAQSDALQQEFMELTRINAALQERLAALTSLDGSNTCAEAPAPAVFGGESPMPFDSHR